MDIREKIDRELKAIEERENVRIILAVESGSRAWGFASDDSDYDVRFIYVRKEEDYLRINEIRDVIELPIDDELDINGWDLKKALGLMYKSNPTLIEWSMSPIIYRDSETADELRELIRDYFSVRRSLWHYLSMASGNMKEHLSADLVKAKKYFYVLRPVLASKWIIERQTPPPMLFEELSEAELPEYLRSDVDRLLDIKINSPETKTIKRVDSINEYLEKSIEEIRKSIDEIQEKKHHSWDGINEFFVRTVRKLG